MNIFFKASLVILFVTNTKSSDLSEVLQEEITKYVENGESANVTKVIELLFDSLKDDHTNNNAYCVSCRVVANTAIAMRKSGADKPTLGDFITNMCKLFSFSGAKTCEGLIDISLNSWLYIIDNKNVTGERICSIRLQKRNCQDFTYVPWNINIPEGKSKILLKDNIVQVKKILQLTDVHYDPLYKPGSNANCGESVCCETVNGIPRSIDDAAGYWGDYHVCDMPWHSIQNVMEDIRNKHPDIERVYFTGDIIGHQTWATSVEGNSKTIRTFMQNMKQTFGDTPVYPILGNHEPHPVDLFPPLDTEEDISMQWLYEVIAEEWTQWLPKETKKTIRKGGYYSVLVKPGFRIIGINSNVCFTNNAWLVFDDRDPLGQLQWLADELFEAEKNDEVVHILSHVPPGDDECMTQWSHEFKRIIERFHGIISGQFNGHTHLDELKVFYAPNDNDRVINVAFNGGSVTTFVGFNPNYKIYYVGEQNQMVDYELWTYDLLQANNNTTPNWYKLYSFKKDFKLEDLNFNSFHNLLKRMSVDDSLLEKYQRFRVRNSSIIMQQPYDKEFLNNLHCDITSVEYKIPKQCKNFSRLS
ncbi:hypothetical protein FQR65_LT05573 [Abscondita terminalis]|nr:hypothetical protein FQR65_LT05573 [Abscondita terminalis]